MRSQQVNVGIDPMVFANMVSEAHKMVQESEGGAQGLEHLAVNVAENLYQSNCNRASSLQLLTQGIQATKMKLEEQIHQHRMVTEQMEHHKVQLIDQVHQNRVWATEMESEKSRVHNLFDHKNAEITRLTSEVSSLQSANARLERRSLSCVP